jgi:hypothetical protein
MKLGVSSLVAGSLPVSKGTHEWSALEVSEEGTENVHCHVVSADITLTVEVPTRFDREVEPG